MTEPVSATRAETAVAGVALAASSAVACLLEASWLTRRIGVVAVPVTVVTAAVWSLLLVRVAGRWSTSPAFRSVPIVAWSVTLVAMDLGPGGDMPVQVGLRSLALVVAGVLIPLWSLGLTPARDAETDPR